MTLPPEHFAVLNSVHTYRFLTNGQLSRLLGKSRARISRITQMLAKRTAQQRALLHVAKFPVHVRLGRLEYLYSLTSAGCLVLQEHGITAKVTRNAPAFSRDYFHRTATIECDLLFDLALRQTPWSICQRQHYFTFQGANHARRSTKPLTSINKICFADGQFFISDTIFQIEHTQTKQLILCALEYVRGDKVMRTVAQVMRHATALREGNLSRTCGLQQDYLALFVFERADLCERVVQRCTGESFLDGLAENFLFAPLSDLQHNALQCWRMLKKQGYLFDLLTGKVAFRLPSNF
jgi:hypothetical protein